MGTDIHVYLEERHKDGKWHCVGKDMYDGRDYNLFNLLAGARWDCGCMLKELEGVPSDASWYVDNEWGSHKYWCYNSTWYGLNELFDAFWEKDDNGFEDDADSLECFLQSIIDYMVKDMSLFQVWKFRRQFPKIVKRFRVIIWFDS